MNKIFLLASFFVISAVGQLSAEMVRYVDETGKPHYVNTDYSTVPEQYRLQVEAQLKAIETEKTTETPMMPKEPAVPLPVPGQSTSKQTLPVTLYMTQDCQQCRVMGMLLSKEGIKVTTVDINTPEGKEQYEPLKTTVLPLTVVGEKVVPGFNPSQVIALAQGKEPPPDMKNPAKDFVNPFQR